MASSSWNYIWHQDWYICKIHNLNECLRKGRHQNALVKLFTIFSSIKYMYIYIYIYILVLLCIYNIYVNIEIYIYIYIYHIILYIYTYLYMYKYHLHSVCHEFLVITKIYIFQKSEDWNPWSSNNGPIHSAV